MSRRWFLRAFLTAYMLTIAGCACGITGKVPYRVAVRIISGNPAYGAIPEQPTVFGVRWARQYNKAAYIARDPWRIHQIACVTTKYHGVYACLLREQNKASGAVKCFTLGLTTSQYVFDVKPHACPAVSA